MFLTEKEILDTPVALDLTCKYFEENAEKIEAFFAANPQRKFTIMGCGSSYMLSKSAAALLGAYPETTANAIPAGDYIADPVFWQETVRGSIVLMLSRSGRTSEMVWAAQKIKDLLNCPIISINAENDNDITPMSDLELSMPWCHDNSVCQTRTVTNLYAASLLLAAKYAKDETLWKSVRRQTMKRSRRSIVPFWKRLRCAAGKMLLCWQTGRCAALQKKVRWPLRRLPC